MCPEFPGSSSGGGRSSRSLKQGRADKRGSSAQPSPELTGTKKNLSAHLHTSAGFPDLLGDERS